MLVVMYLALDVSWLLTLALAVPTAGFQVRTFIVFHDCTHGSLLPSRRANTIVGAVCGFLVLAPFRRWGHDHAVHHASSGDLDRRGVGDLPTLTVSEYNAREWRGRLAYRLFRNPLIMFGLGPVFAMIIGPRIATRAQRPRMRRSVLLTDLAILIVFGTAITLVGFGPFLIVWAPAALMAGSAGIWLFYVQHTFEDAYWERGGEWCYADAALRGSSYLKLPGAAVLLGQHRAAPRASPQRQDPELQPPARPRRSRGVRQRADPVADGRDARGAVEAVGREGLADGRLRRRAPQAPGRLPRPDAAVGPPGATRAGPRRGARERHGRRSGNG